MDINNNNNNNCKIDKMNKIKNKINNNNNNNNNRMLNWKRWKLKLLEIKSSAFEFPQINLFFNIVLFILIIFPNQINSINSCDWTGSGLSTSSSSSSSSSHNVREIVSIYLRCTAGKIIWKYPRGAIRVLLRPTFTNAVVTTAASSAASAADLRRNQRNFRVCIKVHRKNYENNSDNNYKNNKNSDNNNNNNKNQINTTNNDLITNSAGSGKTIKQIARIYLEAPKRLISLYDDDNDENNEQIVKCFMSINQQVALYVEANETPFENLQTIFEYNLEFINNKQYLMMTPLPATVTATTSRGGILAAPPSSNSNEYHDFDDDDVDNNIMEVNEFLYFDDNQYDKDEGKLSMNKVAKTAHRLKTKSNNNKNNIDQGTWNWLSRWWSSLVDELSIYDSTNEKQVTRTRPLPLPIDDDSSIKDYDLQINDKKKKDIIKFNDSEYYHIIGKYGESWEICRPCTHIEMVTTYCSSDIVTRGTIFNVQEQSSLNTIELTINQTKILRNNVNAILNAEYSSSATSMNNNNNNNMNMNNNENNRMYNKKRKLLRKIISNNARQPDDDDSLTTTNEQQKIPDAFKFHTPIHCGASNGDGEFVFMGRIRFQEIMLICAPRLMEWIHVVNTFNATDNAPCILKA